MATGTMIAIAFVPLGVAIGAQVVMAWRTIAALPDDDPATGRWRAALALSTLFVAGFVGALASVWAGWDAYPGLLLGALCLFGAGIVNMTARSGGGPHSKRERERFEERLEHRAMHDMLTGLPNRALFVDRLDRLLEYKGKRQTGRIFAVLIVDIDRFKVINDSLGHAIGDSLLQEVARRLEACIRGTDTVARLGGDEFAILVDDIVDTSDTVRVADRIREALVPLVRIDQHQLRAAASIGIVLSETGYHQAGDVLRDADIAMYRAKSLGGARHEIFDTAMRDRMTHRLSLENELRRALERDEFRLAYQPIIDLSTDGLVGFEALVRWQHPERGLVSPFHFIGLAEQTGQIIEIDRWVLREACRQMKAWQSRLPLAQQLLISTNLSSKQFTTPDLVSYVSNVLVETGLDPACLEVELTETAFIESLGPIKSTLDDLRKLGVGLKLDDFGTGYASLSYLHQLPFDFLKIDRSFVMKMTDSAADLAIVHTVLLLARALDIRVVAEGVETVEQLAQLKRLHCDYAQGYLFSKPVAPEEAERFILRPPEDPALVAALAPIAAIPEQHP